MSDTCTGVIHDHPLPCVGASTVYSIVCNATSYQGVSVKAIEDNRSSPSLRRIQYVESTLHCLQASDSA
jgi:hypothetical protein